VEIRYCLKGLHLLEDELMGSGSKLPGPNSLPRTQSNSLGSSLPPPKSMMPASPSSTRSPSKLAQLSKGKVPLHFPIKRPKIMFKTKARSVFRLIPTPQFSLDAGASTSDVQLESLGLVSPISKSTFRLGYPGPVYHSRKLRNHHSSAVWKVKQGKTKPDAGTSQNREKDAVSSMIGEEDTSPASKEVLCGGVGEPRVLQLANRQSEELVVSYLGLESDGSSQSGFGSYVARETTDLEEKGFVVGNGVSMALQEEGGGLLLAPQVPSSQLCVGLGSSGSGVDLVAQRQEEGSLELVFFPQKKVKWVSNQKQIQWDHKWRNASGKEHETKWRVGLLLKAWWLRRELI
jgi:hypothetical protein